MGTQLKASCRCGVNADVKIGGGMWDPETCVFPCLCENCHNIVQAYLVAENPKCPKCRGRDLVPYDDPQLIGTPGSRNLAEWNMQASLGRELVLTDGTYKCPRCGNMSLTFDQGDISVLWD